MAESTLMVEGTAVGKYASQLLKASCASYAKGLRLLQRSTGPFADRSLYMLCADHREHFCYENALDGLVYETHV